MTKIVRASLGLPTLRAGPQFQNSKPVFETQHIVRGKGKIKIGAAFSETGNTGVASEGEFTVHHGLHAAFC